MSIHALQKHVLLRVKRSLTDFCSPRQQLGVELPDSI